MTFRYSEFESGVGCLSRKRLSSAIPRSRIRKRQRTRHSVSGACRREQNPCILATGQAEQKASSAALRPCLIYGATFPEDFPDGWSSSRREIVIAFEQACKFIFAPRWSYSQDLMPVHASRDRSPATSPSSRFLRHRAG